MAIIPAFDVSQGLNANLTQARIKEQRVYFNFLFGFATSLPSGATKGRNNRHT